MSKRWVFLLLTVCLLIPIVASAGTPEVSQGLHQNTDVDIWISSYGWHHFWYTGLDSGDTINVEIEVTDGPGIDFFICDDTNWDIWEGGDTASVYRLMENRGSVSTSFAVPRSGTWHIVFDSDSFSDIHVEGTIGVSSYVPTTSPGSPASSGVIGGLITAAVIIFLIAMFIACAMKLNDGRDRPEMEQSLSQQPSYQHEPAQQEQVILFCQYCGTQRQSSDALFCSRCGKAFTES